MTTCFTSPTVWYMIEKCKKSIANWKQKALAFKVKVAPLKHVSCRGETQPWLWRQAVSVSNLCHHFSSFTVVQRVLGKHLQTMGDRNKLLATARGVLVQRPATSSNNPPTWWGITHYSLETVVSRVNWTVSRPVWLRPDKCTNIRNNPSINKLADCYTSLFDTP